MKCLRTTSPGSNYTGSNKKKLWNTLDCSFRCWILNADEVFGFFTDCCTISIVDFILYSKCS